MKKHRFTAFFAVESIAKDQIILKSWYQPVSRGTNVQHDSKGVRFLWHAGRQGAHVQIVQMLRDRGPEPVQMLVKTDIWHSIMKCLLERRPCLY
jgi:hypothetical protein